MIRVWPKMLRGPVVFRLLAAGVGLAAAPAWAQQPTTPSSNPPSSGAPADSAVVDQSFNQEPPNYVQGTQGLNPSHPLPADAYLNQDPTGLPYSGVPILDRTGGDLNNWPDFRGDLFNTGIDHPTKIGSAEGNFSISTGNLGVNTPFIEQGAEPENADIKAGPIFIKFHDLDGLLLYSDNYQHRQTDRKSELLALIRLNLSVIAQLTDNLQFVASGSIIYLPLQNQLGFTGGSAYNALGLFLFAAPLFATQMSYDTIIAGWPVTFYDQFEVHNGSYASDAADSFRYFKGDYLDRDENGGYILHSSRNSPTNTPSENLSPNYDASIVYMSNQVGADTERMLPGDIRLQMGARHEDIWYNNAVRGLPPSRDQFYASLETERPNMRFNMLLSYSATYVEGYPGITQQVNAGIFGPIDDQIFLNAGAGLYVDANNHSGELFWLFLSHEAGPYTEEQLGVSRTLSDFNDFVTTSEYYRIEQTLGPTLNATAFLEHEDSEDLINGDNASFGQELAGLNLSWQMGPLTTLNLYGIAERQDFANGGRTDTLTARAVLNRIVTDSLTLQLLYQYQRAFSSLSGQSYFENLVYFRFIYSFD